MKIVRQENVILEITCKAEERHEVIDKMSEYNFIPMGLHKDVPKKGFYHIRFVATSSPTVFEDICFPDLGVYCIPPWESV